MSFSHLRITSMTPTELTSVLSWASHEGWNVIHHATDAYYAADPTGFFVLKDEHKIIASLSRVVYPEGLSFIGLYIVDPTLRHRGYGKYLWDNVNKNNDEYTCVALEAVMAQVENYQKSGFKLFNTTKRYRYENNPSHHLNENILKDICLLESVNFGELLNYDQSVFSQNRESFLRVWVQLPGAKFIAARNEQGLCGYGQLVNADQGYRVSPLFADNAEIARAILITLCQSLPEFTDIYLDIPNENLYSKDLIDELKLTEVFTTALMYYQGHQAKTQLDKVFSKTTLEIG